MTELENSKDDWAFDHEFDSEEEEEKYLNEQDQHILELERRNQLLRKYGL